jgi:hypothetical protein
MGKILLSVNKYRPRNRPMGVRCSGDDQRETKVAKKRNGIDSSTGKSGFGFAGTANGPSGEFKPDLMGGRVARNQFHAHSVTGLGVWGRYLRPHRRVGQLNGREATLD